MRKNKIAGIVGGLISAVCGCTELDRNNSIEFGGGVRTISGRYLGYKVEQLPFSRVQVNHRLDEKTDVYRRFDYIQGELDAKRNILNGSVTGQFESGGIGIRHFPFSKYWGVEMGVEAFHADYDMNGRLGQVKMKIPDSASGFGGTVGLISAVPLDKKEKVFLEFSTGYNFGKSWAEKADVNFNGLYGTLGIRINLTGD